MAKTTKKLKDIHRIFLVQEFACFASPMEAADALKQEFGVEITPQGAQHYDATSVNSKMRLAAKWQELFKVARQAFLDDVETRIPESYKSKSVASWSVGISSDQLATLRRSRNATPCRGRSLSEDS